MIQTGFWVAVIDVYFAVEARETGQAVTSEPKNQ